MLKKLVIAFSLILWPLNLILNFGNIHFSSESVFKNDYQGEQLVLRNIHLYPSPLFARVFQNKPRIYIYKYAGNLFALTDPNNYFFALHPEPISGNLNLHKYPFMDIFFFLIGLFYLGKYKYKKAVFILLIPSLLILAAFKTFEGPDVILYFPISMIIINGINHMEKKNKKYFILYAVFFILFTIPEIIRSFYTK